MCTYHSCCNYAPVHVFGADDKNTTSSRKLCGSTPHAAEELCET